MNYSNLNDEELLNIHGGGPLKEWYNDIKYVYNDIKNCWDNIQDFCDGFWAGFNN